MNHNWRLYAKCRAVGNLEENFFSDSVDKEQKMKDMCWGNDEQDECPVRAQCFAAAIAAGSNQQYGVWGGYSADERKQMIKRRKLAS